MKKQRGHVGKLKMILRERFAPIAKADVLFPGQAAPVPWWFFLEPDVVLIIPLMQSGRCIINKQWKPGAKDFVYEFPTGYLEKTDQSPLYAARRELKEETGYVATHIKKIAEFFVSPTNQPTRVYVFLATGLRLTNQKIIHKGDEQIENIEIPLRELYSAVCSGKINTMATAAAACALSCHVQVSRNKRRKA